MTRKRKTARPRISSPKGVAERQESRIKGFTPEIPKGDGGKLKAHKPGSSNRRKVGRLCLRGVWFTGLYGSWLPLRCSSRWRFTHW